LTQASAVTSLRARVDGSRGGATPLPRPTRVGFLDEIIRSVSLASNSSQPWRSQRFGAILALAAALLFFSGACSTSIGDECTTSLDCPSGTFCDTTSPDGYCLSSGCESNGDCVEDGVCIHFDDFTSYCLLGCSSKDDCRDGYACRSDLGPDKFCYIQTPVDEPPFQRAP